MGPEVHAHLSDDARRAVYLSLLALASCEWYGRVFAIRRTAPASAVAQRSVRSSTYSICLEFYDFPEVIATVSAAPPTIVAPISGGLEL